MNDDMKELGNKKPYFRYEGTEMMKLKYKILEAEGRGNLEKLVNEYLQDNWSLVGGISAQDRYYTQAVCKW